MGVVPLLKKEAYTARRHAALFLLVLVVFPAVFTMGTGMYDRTVPEDIPVAIAPVDANTTEDDISIIRGGVTFFATPITYEDPAEAREDLHREQVYIVMEVPGDMTDPERDVTFTMVSDDHFVPFQDPANISADILDNYLDRALQANVTLEHERLGEPRGLSSFLVPAVLLVFIILYGAVYVPHQLYRERSVLERLRTETRLEVVAGAKLLFHGVAVLVPLLVTAGFASWLEYDLTAIDPFSTLVYLLSYLFAAAAGLAILFALNLKRQALFVNFGLAIVMLASASLIYPVGFFSSAEQVITRANPAHYAVVLLRSTMLRDVSMALYVDFLAISVLVAGGSVGLLGIAIAWYRRSQ